MAGKGQMIITDVKNDRLKSQEPNLGQIAFSLIALEFF